MELENGFYDSIFYAFGFYGVFYCGGGGGGRRGNRHFYFEEIGNRLVGEEGGGGGEEGEMAIEYIGEIKWIFWNSFFILCFLVY
jgi:hypothetical protein